MLATPGCCAREDMGAALAGVFCGVGADIESSFLLRIGSDMLAVEQNRAEQKLLVWMFREGVVVLVV